MTTNDIKTISTTEGNLVKGLLGLSRKSRTNRIGAVSKDPITGKIKISKLNFICQLTANNLTRKLTNNALTSKPDNKSRSLLNEVVKIISEYEDKINLESFHGTEPINYDILDKPRDF